MRGIHDEGSERIPSGCAISSIFSKSGKPINGERIIHSMAPMHDRSNGLGGGFAGYGIYPQHKDDYAFHVFYDHSKAQNACESFLKERFCFAASEQIPTRKLSAITQEPISMRYFLRPLYRRMEDLQLDESEYVARCVLHINAQIDGAYVFSSGKNMGVCAHAQS